MVALRDCGAALGLTWTWARTAVVQAAPPSDEYCTRFPYSFRACSDQERLTDVADAVPVRPDGAVGSVLCALKTVAGTGARVAGAPGVLQSSRATAPPPRSAKVMMIGYCCPA